MEKGPDPRTAKREFHAALARLLLWLETWFSDFWEKKGQTYEKLVTVQNSIHCRLHDSGVLETVF